MNRIVHIESFVLQYITVHCMHKCNTYIHTLRMLERIRTKIMGFVQRVHTETNKSTEWIIITILASLKEPLPSPPPTS